VAGKRSEEILVTTLEDEFQKPVRDRLAEIVINLDPLPAWQLDLMCPPTNYDQWMRQAQSFQDGQVEHHRREMDDIARGVHGSIHGTFPTPTPRKRVRKKKR
jgi:hypothetical protein